MQDNTSNSMSNNNDEGIDLDNPKLSNFDIYREGLRRDGIEILHYETRFPIPGTKGERRIERFVSGMFLLSGFFALAFVAAFIWWPWEYNPTEAEGVAAATGWFNEDSGLFNWSGHYTTVLGVTFALSLIALAIAVLTWAKKLLPVEELVQDRHDGPSSKDDRKIGASVADNMIEDIGIKRRPFLKKAAILGAAPVGLAAIAPLGALITDPGDMLTVTGWNPKKVREPDEDMTHEEFEHDRLAQAGSFNGNAYVRLMLRDGTLVRPDMVSTGGQLTVYPAIAHGASNKEALAPTLLINLREDDAEELTGNLFPMYAKVNVDGTDMPATYGNFVAYSKICSHVGCPASLYEQQSQRLLCPCHQSQFDVTDNAIPIFGPATRHLPMLPITVDDEGFFIATTDFLVPPGPAFWNRPTLPEGWEE